MSVPRHSLQAALWASLGGSPGPALHPPSLRCSSSLLRAGSAQMMIPLRFSVETLWFVLKARRFLSLGGGLSSHSPPLEIGQLVLSVPRPYPACGCASVPQSAITYTPSQPGDTR